MGAKDITGREIHLITDRALAGELSIMDAAEAALKGGASVVQLREKRLDTREFYRDGLKIKEIAAAYDAVFIVNDRIDVALALDADGVHLGREDIPIEVARRILGPDKIIGLTIKAPDQALEPAAGYADYLGAGPIYRTSVKPELTSTWGPEGVRLVKTMTDLPIVAIGGIKPSNARAVIEAGADAVAVISAVMAADDPEDATRRLLAEIRAGRAPQVRID